MSFAINFIIDHPEENKTDNSSNLTNYYWDDFFTSTVNEISGETIEQGFQEQEQQLTPKDPLVQDPMVEHSPIPTLPINLPSPLPLLEATKPLPPTILTSPPPPSHLPSSLTSNILPPIILPPLTPFAVHIPPPKKIELPTTNTTPSSEIVSPPIKLR